MRPFPASAVGTRPKMPSLTLCRRPGQREHTAGAVHGQGGGSWCPQCWGSPAEVPGRGGVLCALAGDAPEEPGPPDPWNCVSPVAYATFPCTAGIPGLCQLWHPISARLCHHPSHCWDGDRPSHCVLWGSSDQLRAPQSQAMSVCLVSLGSCPGDGGTFCAVLSPLAVVPRAAAPARPGSPGYL